MSNPGVVSGPSVVAPVLTGANDAAGNGATTTLAIPAGAQVGDLCLAFFGWQSNAAAPAAPAGWLLRNAVDLSEGNSIGVAIYSHVVEAGEPGANVTFNTVNGVSWVLKLRSYTCGGLGEVGFAGSTSATATPPQVPVRHGGTGNTCCTFTMANMSNIGGSINFAAGGGHTSQATQGFMVGAFQDFAGKVNGGAITAAAAGPITGSVSLSVALDPVVTGA